MMKQFVAVVGGVLIWYFLNILTRIFMLQSPAEIGTMRVCYTLTLIYTILVGFISATIAGKNKYLIAVGTILLAYAPLAIFVLHPSKQFSELPISPSVLSVLVVAIGLTIMAIIGAVLSRVVYKEEKNENNI